MFEENGFEIALVNTDGLWYGLLTHLESGWKYETAPYKDRDACKEMSRLLTYLEMETVAFPELY